MNGSPAHQVHIIWSQSGINQTGQSRFEAKEEIRTELKEAGKPADSASVNSQMGVYSYATADQYRNVWREFLTETRENFGEKSIDNLTSQHAHAYLVSKIHDGCSRETLEKYAAALQKLETAVNMHISKQGWDKEASYNLSDFREDIKAIPKAELEARAFFNPQNVINNLQSETSKLVAKTQLEGGFRIHEVNHLQEKNLKGLEKDPVIREEKGKIQIPGKGGKIRETFISKETYKSLEKAIQESPNKRFEFNKDTYNRHLKEAGRQAGDRQETSHALRHNFAQNRVNECCKNGKTFEEAKQIVSLELGHNRPEITEIYLR